MTADVSAIDITVAGPRIAEVVYRFQRGMPYRSLIEIDGDRVTAEPRRNRCGFTSAEVPEECLETCQVTGRRGLRELMARSDIGGGYAVPESVLTCSLTGKQMLQTESEICALTGAVAARNALAKSDVSGVIADRRLVRRCCVSGKAGLKSELVKSAISGKWMLPEHAVTLAGGQSAGRHEATLCQWTDAFFPNSKIGTCSLSGIQVDRRLLNAAGEFGPLRVVLDGELLGQPFFAPGILTRQAPEIFRGIRSCDHVLSASAKAAILYGSTSFFGFNRRVFAVIALGDRASLKLTGKALFGKRTAGVWSPTDVHAVA